ncbi:MAG TPA: hypothetical protein VF157_11095 [Chloroflexota bacterium]
MSRVWGVGRRTTESLPGIAFRIDKEELLPGDALNLTIEQDPQGYGHVRLFAGWANSQHTRMWVYEETPPRVVHHVIAYDSRYAPIRRINYSPGDLAASHLLNVLFGHPDTSLAAPDASADPAADDQEASGAAPQAPAPQPENPAPRGLMGKPIQGNVAPAAAFVPWVWPGDDDDIPVAPTPRFRAALDWDWAWATPTAAPHVSPQPAPAPSQPALPVPHPRTSAPAVTPQPSQEIATNQASWSEPPKAVPTAVSWSWQPVSTSPSRTTLSTSTPAYSRAVRQWQPSTDTTAASGAWTGQSSGSRWSWQPTTDSSASSPGMTRQRQPAIDASSSGSQWTDQGSSTRQWPSTDSTANPASSSAEGSRTAFAPQAASGSATGWRESAAGAAPAKASTSTQRHSEAAPQAPHATQQARAAEPPREPARPSPAAPKQQIERKSRWG